MIGRANRKRWSWWWALAGLMVLWPGDAPWINDEPLLVRLALEANAQGVWAGHGLQGGAFGLVHGPLSVWICQIVLKVTDDLVWITGVKAAGFALVLVFCLAAAVRGKKLGAEMVALALASPLIWLAARKLWDNCWLVPLAAMVFWIYERFAERPSPGKLAALGILSLVMVHTHLMSLLLIAPLALSLILTRWAWISARAVAALALLTGLALAALPYLALVLPRLGSAATAVDLHLGRGLQSLWAGATVMGGLGPAIAFLPEMATDHFVLPHGLTMTLLGWTTTVNLVLFAIGLVACGKSVARPTPSSGQARPLAALNIGCVLITAVFFGVGAAPMQAHYFSAVWPAYWGCIWKGGTVLAERFGAKPWPLLLLRTNVGAMAVLLAAMMVFVHINGGTRTPFYGATLGNQLQVAGDISRCRPACRIASRVFNYALFPHSLEVLLQMARPGPVPPPTATARLWRLDYRDGQPGAVSGWIALKPVADDRGPVGGPLEGGTWR